MLYVQEKDRRMVVDAPSVEITGQATGGEAVSVSVNGGAAKAVSLASGGRFSLEVSLDIGLNEIAVTATDGAGLTSRTVIPVIRLITDRTQADVDQLTALMAVPMSEWDGGASVGLAVVGIAAAGTMARAVWFDRVVLRGSYDYTDLNRVTLAMACLAAHMRGYNIPLAAKSSWTKEDVLYPAEAAKYLADVAALRRQAAVPEDTPAVPETMEKPTIDAANNIEKILAAVDRLRALSGLSWFYSGEVYSGEV